MYDKLTFEVNNRPPDSRLEQLLTDVTISEARNTGKHTLSGKLRGYNVRTREHSLIVTGSIPKSVKGHNLFALDFEENRREILERCEQLWTKPKDTQLWNTEIGTSILTDKETNGYLQRFGEWSCIYPFRITSRGKIQSLTYKQQQQILRYYSKIPEIAKQVQRGKIHPECLPQDWKNMNALRMEIALKKRLTIALKTGNRVGVSLADLIEPKTYRHAVEIWKREYFAIKKRKIMTLNDLEAFSGPKAMTEYLALKGLIAEGEDQLLDEIRSTPDKTNRKRMRAKVRALGSIRTYTEESPMIVELDRKVREEAAAQIDSIT